MLGLERERYIQGGAAAGARARGRIVLGLERERHLAIIQGDRNSRTRFAGGGASDRGAKVEIQG